MNTGREIVRFIAVSLSGVCAVLYLIVLVARPLDLLLMLVVPLVSPWIQIAAWLIAMSGDSFEDEMATRYVFVFNVLSTLFGLGFAFTLGIHDVLFGIALSVGKFQILSTAVISIGMFLRRRQKRRSEADTQ
ncbi:MAG: hypothetical protein KF784_04445 [Fimbriimonadaceae bacterium]|nr:hypothetical protein [Fimbriimonadaceae bacterium]